MLVRPSWLFRCLLVLPLCSAQAQVTVAPAANAYELADNAGWVREFAAPDTPPDKPRIVGVGRGNDLNWDPRFVALLHSSFRQRQWFWYDHYKFPPLPDVVQTFLAVPGDVILDKDRYVTVDGCVPHAGYLRGLLWMDTGEHPAAVIFSGIDLVSSESGKESYHLWLFSSKKLARNQMPGPFLASLHRWLTILSTNGYRGTNGYKYHFDLVTLVQPTGEMVDISPETMHLNPSVSEAKK